MKKPHQHEKSESVRMPECTWTIETLKEHFEALRRADREQAEALRRDDKLALDAALQAVKEQNREASEANEKAIQKADAAGEKRFDAMNEFRAQLKDQQATFITRNESEIGFRELRNLIEVAAKDIGQIQRGESRGAGGVDASAKAKQQMNWMIGITIALIGVIISATIGSLTVIGGLIYFLLSHK